MRISDLSSDVCSSDLGIYVSFEGEGAPKEPQRYDLVLQAVGRSPNGKKIGADKAGVAVTDRGFIEVDKQMRTNVPHIYAIGDIVGQPMLAHKAVHEAHVAAEVIAGEKSFFDARVIPSVARSEEHTSELQSLMRISYAVLCLKKKKSKNLT